MKLHALTQKIFLPAVLLGIGSVVFGALRKILHAPDADTWLIAGMILTAVYTVLALYEIFSSRTIPYFQKVAWLLGFLFFNIVAALLYVFVRRSIIASPN